MDTIGAYRRATAVLTLLLYNGLDMTSNWLDASVWKLVQASVPICCVDVLPVKFKGDEPGLIEQVGLIYRDTPHQGRRWCLVGGRLRLNESLVEGATRQLHETLGDDVKFAVPRDQQPFHVHQYFPIGKEVGGVDPRQHAVAMVFVVAISGDAVPQGEAIGFDWFALEKLPDDSDFGFGQEKVVHACLFKSGQLAGRSASPLSSR